ASGAYTSEATPALRKKIIPIGSYIIATEVLPADLARELSPRNRMIYDSKHFLYYYRLTPDNRMLFGGRAAFFPETENTVRRRSARSAQRQHLGAPSCRRVVPNPRFLHVTRTSVLSPHLSQRDQSSSALFSSY